MSWKKLKIQYRLIIDKILSKKDYKKEWEVFRKLATEISK